MLPLCSVPCFVEFPMICKGLPERLCVASEWLLEHLNSCQQQQNSSRAAAAEQQQEQRRSSSSNAAAALAGNHSRGHGKPSDLASRRTGIARQTRELREKEHHRSSGIVQSRHETSEHENSARERTFKDQWTCSILIRNEENYF